MGMRDSAREAAHCQSRKERSRKDKDFGPHFHSDIVLALSG
jgi:hypothetical protein